MAKTRACRSASGEAIYVRTPTAGYPPRPLRTCARCGREVVWVERSGGRYSLVEVVTYEARGAERESRWYAPWQPHRCVQERIAELEEELAGLGFGYLPEYRAELEEELAGLRYEVASPEERRRMEASWEAERSERMAGAYGLGL